MMIFLALELMIVEESTKIHQLNGNLEIQHKGIHFYKNIHDHIQLQVLIDPTHNQLNIKVQNILYLINNIKIQHNINKMICVGLIINQITILEKVIAQKLVLDMPNRSITQQVYHHLIHIHLNIP